MRPPCGQFKFDQPCSWVGKSRGRRLQPPGVSEPGSICSVPAVVKKGRSRPVDRPYGTGGSRRLQTRLRRIPRYARTLAAELIRNTTYRTQFLSARSGDGMRPARIACWLEITDRRPTHAPGDVRATPCRERSACRSERRRNEFQFAARMQTASARDIPPPPAGCKPPERQ